MWKRRKSESRNRGVGSKHQWGVPNPIAIILTERDAVRSHRMTLDIQEILGLLPHRYPFLLIDRIVEFERSKRLVAIVWACVGVATCASMG